MFAYSLKRLGLALLVALAVSMIAFLLLRLSGDPAAAIAGEGATQASIELIRQTYGFNRPLPVQYLAWLGQVVRGDLGESIYFKTPAGPLILSKLKTTLLLGLLSLLFALAVSIPLGVLAAIYRNSWIDRLCLAIAVVGQALPNFFFALLLIMFFSISLRLLPVSGSDTWLHFVMPTIALGYYVAPAFMRLVRAGMVEVLEADYIRTARAKGLPARQVIFKHALRNALIPIITLLGLYLPFLLSGAVLVETIFGWPGMGRALVDAILQRDYPMVMATSFVISAMVVVGNLLSDVLYAVVDPRIRNA